MKMKKLLDLSYEYKNMYPGMEHEIDGIVDLCLQELEKGSKKEETVRKYIELLMEITREDDLE